MSLKQQKIDAIIKKYDGMITGLSDLTASRSPSIIFFILADKLSYLLSTDAEIAISKKGVERRRKINPIIKALGAHFLSNPQVFENRNFLRDPNCTIPTPDTKIALPNEPVIWASNHGFKDDALASVLAAQRHAYILFGSLPQFYNTFDGITAWLVGVAMVNRKVPASKKSSIPKAVRAINCGADLLMYPEGTWNKSPNALVLDLWPGIYRIACETGAKVVPIVHYHRDNNTAKNNLIHTVIDDPIRLDDLTERQALDYIRDIFATWYYLMMEAYGKSTRDEILNGASTFAEAWDKQLEELIRFVARWDIEIETRSDYRPKWKVQPQEAWQVIADITDITPENIGHILYARQLVEQCAREDFQRRF
ncbi:MAG: 1-acyl-sn-glycerol-3-phosphate acyltransferase [Clostridiales bacterium]|nr:1-acyl-sn-glycerol-3-phosphate acyltransferase [Clostridiales bacterium]